MNINEVKIKKIQFQELISLLSQQYEGKSISDFIKFRSMKYFKRIFSFNGVSSLRIIGQFSKKCRNIFIIKTIMLGSMTSFYDDWSHHGGVQKI